MRPSLRIFIAGAVGLFALLVLLDRFVLVELLARRIGVPLVVAAVTAASAIGAGSFARGARRIDPAIDLVVGLPLFGTTCFLVALIKVNILTMAFALALGAVLFAARLLRTPREVPGGADGGVDEPRPTVPGSRFAWLAVAIVVLCGLVMAQAPPISLDELAYHLAVPRAWALEGRAVDLPLSSHSYFPLGVESASLPALTLLGAMRGGIASHLLHLLTAVAVVALLARRTQSWLATAAIAATPALALTAGWSLVEWPLVGIVVALVADVEDGDDRAAAAATAAGLLTKYTFAPLILVAFALARKWRPAMIGAVAGSVFFIRNLVLTGNPVAPFFSGDAPHVAGYRAVDAMDLVFHPRFVDEALGGSILALVAAATGPIALAALGLALVLFLLGPSARILLPFLAVAGVPAGRVIERSRFMRALLSVLVTAQLLLVGWFTAESGAFGLIAGRYSDEEYVRSQRPTIQAIEWLNTTLPAGSRTLVVGAGETYWFERPVRGGGNFDGARMSRYVSLPTDALRERLRRDGITHVAVLAPRVPTSEAMKRAEREGALTPQAQRALAQMLNRHAATVTSRGQDALFSLR